MEGKDSRMSAEELERTLEEYTREMTPDFLRKRLRLALYKKIQAGDISALDDLKTFEEPEAAAAARASATFSGLRNREGGAPPPMKKRSASPKAPASSAITP
jgi:hypothetical protein